MITRINNNNSGFTAAMQEALEIEKDDSVPCYNSVAELNKALLTQDMGEHPKDKHRPNTPSSYRSEFRKLPNELDF